jgi:hypothetical protein
MSLNFSVDENYAWVVLAGVGAGWVTIWQGFKVGWHRKAAKIPYPQSESSFYGRDILVDACPTVYAESSQAAASSVSAARL